MTLRWGVYGDAGRGNSEGGSNVAEFPPPLMDPDQSDLNRCPACGFEMHLAPGIVQGETLWCTGCGAKLEVASTEPVRLDVVAGEE